MAAGQIALLRELLVSKEHLLASKERESNAIIALKDKQIESTTYDLDVTRGRTSVRSVLETVAANYNPRTTKQGINTAIDEMKSYLELVAKKKHVAPKALEDALRGVYSELCGVVHGGSTDHTPPETIPAAVVSNQYAVLGLAAFFKYFHRNILLYNSQLCTPDMLVNDLPSPPVSKPPSPPTSPDQPPRDPSGSATGTE